MISKPENGKDDTSAWYRMMGVAFLANGMHGSRLAVGVALSAHFRRFGAAEAVSRIYQIGLFDQAWSAGPPAARIE